MKVLIITFVMGKVVYYQSPYGTLNIREYLQFIKRTIKKARRTAEQIELLGVPSHYGVSHNHTIGFK